MVAVVLGACVTEDEACGEENTRCFSDAESLQPIDARFVSIARTAVSEEIVEGIQLALIENGEVAVLQAFGLADRESNVPMTIDTPINVASISKSVTAFGVMALAERGLLELDAPIRETLIERELYAELFSDSDVSARMLLSHTSGLDGTSVPVTPATEPLPGLSDILLGNSSVPRPRMRRAPGSGFSYSGAGYLVLQRLIEDRTQRAFADYMAATILLPAGMSGSTFSLASTSLDRVATYYRGDGRRRNPYHLPGAAGGLYSTARDMARYLILYTTAGRPVRQQIISDDGFASLLTPVTNVKEASQQIVTIQYALGHYSYATPEGVRIVFHAGGNPGLRSLFIVAPDRNDGFFAVANNDRGSSVLSALLAAWGDYYELTLHSYF